MTASVPELEKRTSSAAGTIFWMRRATWYSSSVDRAKTPPTSMPLARRFITRAVSVAEDAGAVAHAVVHVLVVVDVPDPPAFAVVHVHGFVGAPITEVG